MKTYSYIIPIHFRQCEEGEYFNPEKNSCDVCHEGTYSIAKNSDNCLKCAKNVNCPGGSTLNVSKNYWRSSNTSDKIYECLQSSEACFGGVDPSN